jgi:prepilin-type N-terminal cleavage/methylation domain-containing protein
MGRLKTLIKSPAGGAVRGFTLVELMVALVAGLIVSAAVLSFFLSSMKSNGEYVQSTRLTQELRNTLDLMTRDLRRAGYDDDGLRFMGNANSSDFTPVCLTASGAPTTCLGAGSEGDCILYAYDRTYANGETTPQYTLGNLDYANGELRGLRLRSYTINGVSTGVVEYAVSSGTTAPACGGAGPAYSSSNTYPGCNSTSLWCPLSDPTRINITSLGLFNRSRTIGANPGAVMARRFDIEIAGQLAGDASVTRSVETSVKLRSDCLRTTIANCNAVPTP